jgi:iron complex outermembrane receptor protein
MSEFKKIQRAKLGLAAGVAMIGIFAGWSVQAQTANSAAPASGSTTLAPIVLQGEGAGETGTGPVNGYVAKKTTVGSKSDTPLNEVPQAVSVVGKQEMNDRGVTNKVDEALRYTAGVLAEPFGVDPDTDWVYIRGFDATQTGVFMDGLNLFSYGFGGFQIDPFMLERVDVLKGPASVLYGGGNAGGIVDYVRKRPTDDPYYYTETGINNFGNAFFGFDFSDKVGSDDTIHYRLTGKIAGGNEYSDFSHDFRGFIMPQIEFSPDESTKLNVWAMASGLKQLHTGNGFLPYVGTVVNAPSFGKLSRDSFYGEPGIDTGAYNQEMLGTEFEHTFDSGLKFSQNLRYSHLYKYENAPYLYGWQGSDPADTYGSYTDPQTADFQLHRLGFQGTSKVDSFNMDNRLSGSFETGPLEHDLMVGVDYKYYQLFNKQSSSPGTPISATNPVYGAAQPATLVYSNQLITQQQVGIYAQDQVHFGDGWLLTANGRYDYVHTDTDNNPTDYSTLSSTYSYNKSAVSGRVGLAYEFDNGLTPYVSAGTFFNPVVVVSTTPDNKPEEGEQYEVGLKYDPTFIDGTFTVSLFNLNRRNVVVTDPATFLSSQIGEVNSRGVEFEGKVNLNQNWKMLGSFSYTDMEDKDDIVAAYVGKKPWLVPSTQASLWLDYTVTDGALEGLSLGGGVRYQGESYADRLNTLKVPDYAVFDAAVRYKRDGWEGSVNVSNLFDKDYVKGCQGVATCGYGDPRTIMFKISKVW